MARDSGPLRADEVLVIREMISEYTYEQQRSKLWRGRLSAARLLIGTAVAVAMLSLQTIALILAARGGR